MDFLNDYFNFYIIPPLLTLITGLSIAFISMTRGKLKSENMLFAILCVWWCLLSPIFISHHLFRGQIDLIMKIERFIHFFYVYVPAIFFLCFSKMIGYRNPVIEKGSFILSFLISLTTPTEYYFSGLWTYRWGYIARGEIFFQIFGAYSMLIVFMIIYIFIKKIISEKNLIIRLKLKYIVFSFILSAVFTLMNIPAINGIDFYPIGNFSFIPFVFLGFGVLRHRLMDIRSILHVTLIWAATSSLVIIPNIVLFMLLFPPSETIVPALYFIIIMLWFSANYLYFRKIQPFIDQLFNKRKYDLKRIEEKFIESISALKTPDELLGQFGDLIKKAFSFKTGEWIRFDTVHNPEKKGDAIDEKLKKWFVETNHLVDRDMASVHGTYLDVRDLLGDFFERRGANFVLPLVHGGELLALLALPERQNLRAFTSGDIRFINNIRVTAAISFANSIMYGNLSRVKDSLEVNVNQLSGLLPICANCKKIRDDRGYWQQLEMYIGDHSEATFSHSLCPECIKKLYPEMAKEILSDD